MAFFDNIKFPFFTLQELNLDWLLAEVKRIAGFMPQDGNPGEILTRKSDGAAWEPPEAVNINIDGLPQDSQIMDNDQLIFYDISAQANRKIKPPDLLDSMCSNGTPYMNGTGSAGTSKKPSRYDHVHPTDTSRQAALSGTQMNAVNSGAPASCFSSNKLKIENGGTAADNAPDARTNLGIINPPDLANMQKTALTSGTALNVTSSGGWYCVIAINKNVSDICSAFLSNQNQTTYYSAAQGGTGTFLRSSTSWIYFPQGFKFAARAFFTDDDSGLFFANPL